MIGIIISSPSSSAKLGSTGPKPPSNSYANLAPKAQIKAKKALAGPLGPCYAPPMLASSPISPLARVPCPAKGNAADELTSYRAWRTGSHLSRQSARSFTFSPLTKATLETKVSLLTTKSASALSRTTLTNANGTAQRACAQAALSLGEGALQRQVYTLASLQLAKSRVAVTHSTAQSELGAALFSTEPTLRARAKAKCRLASPPTAYDLLNRRLITGKRSLGQVATTLGSVVSLARQGSDKQRADHGFIARRDPCLAFTFAYARDLGMTTLPVATCWRRLTFSTPPKPPRRLNTSIPVWSTVVAYKPTDSQRRVLCGTFN